MNESILLNVKKLLGLEEDYTVFDTDVLTHINSAFSTLNQLGLGPQDGFFITGPENTWDEFLGADIKLNSVKSYVYLKVRLLFDPPTTSFGINAFEKVVEELEWRLNTAREFIEYPIIPPEDIVDGGVPVD